MAHQPRRSSHTTPVHSQNKTTEENRKLVTPFSGDRGVYFINKLQETTHFGLVLGECVLVLGVQRYTCNPGCYNRYDVYSTGTCL